MSKRFLTTQQLVNLDNDPVTGTSGELYYNTVENVIKYYDGTSWTKELAKNADGGNAYTSFNTSDVIIDCGSV
jgi:hypothetical protein